MSESAPLDNFCDICEADPCICDVGDDCITCSWCGRPFNDGGGLYCSAECESMGNGDEF